jgi:hypothetical protein
VDNVLAAGVGVGDNGGYCDGRLERDRIVENPGDVDGRSYGISLARYSGQSRATARVRFFGLYTTRSFQSSTNKNSIASMLFPAERSSSQMKPLVWASRILFRRTALAACGAIAANKRYLSARRWANRSRFSRRDAG